jgi:hypothetical protein
MKVIDADFHPVHHRLEDRIRAHAFICLLSTYVTFHLRRVFVPFTPTPSDRHGPTRSHWLQVPPRQGARSPPR